MVTLIFDICDSFRRRSPARVTASCFCGIRFCSCDFGAGLPRCQTCVWV